MSAQAALLPMPYPDLPQLLCPKYHLQVLDRLTCPRITRNQVDILRHPHRPLRLEVLGEVLVNPNDNCL